MKKVIVCMLLLFFVFGGVCLADPTSTDDLWDVSQGSVVTATSGVITGSYADNMFGNVHDGTLEPYRTLFKDGQESGFTHWIEWQSHSIMTLKSFNLVAAHDGDSTYIPGSINRRGFSEFKLFAWDGSDWSSIFDYATDDDGDGWYGGGTTFTAKNWLELTVNLDSPVIAQFFRAEFVQAGGTYGGGPRVVELDGYDHYLGDDEGGNPVPEPTTVLLLAMGLLVLGCVRRRMLQTA